MLNNKPRLCSRNEYLTATRTSVLRCGRRALSQYAVIAAVLGALVCTVAGKASDWGPWKPMEDHPGVDFRLCTIADNPLPNGNYGWTVEFRNRYDRVVSFSYKITRPDEQPGIYYFRAKMNPGETLGGGVFGVPVPPDGEVMLWTDRWEFDR